MQQISEYELILMKIIWNNGGTALYAEIDSSLEDRGTPRTKKTNNTISSRLASKGFLKTNKIGRRNEYTAVVSEAEYQEVQTQDFLEKVYECDAKGLVATLLQKDLLSCEDYEDLKRHWEKGGSHK